MKRRNALSLFLSLSLLLTLAVPAATAYAEGSADSGMVTSKTATPNEDGSYTITLEAYATGSKVISEVKKDVPTDIILVLDQSGSMDNDIGQIAYVQYEDEYDLWYGTTYHTRNQDYYEYRHNGGTENLWYKLSDGSYVSVSVTKNTEYTALSTSLVNYSTTSYGSLTTGCYWYYRNNLYEKVGEDYKKVEVNWERSGRAYSYTYTFNDGTVTSSGDNTVPNLGSHAPLYTPVADGDSTVYTYTYTDSGGNVKIIGTSTGATTRFTPAFYQRTTTSGGGSRLNALKTAVTTFSNQVAAKAKGADGLIETEDDINHRIAVVGFASGDTYSNQRYNYENTEVFVGSNQYTYGSAAQGQYANAFQAMNTQAGVNNISASIGALDAEGGTLTNLGLEMANGIFEKNPIPTGEKRNRVVIVFTDGVPGWSGYDSSTATSAISQASTSKNTYGATVYTVGIFSGADATSAGNQNGDETQQANWFMQQVSSNNGTPQSPSYYLSAADSGSLNNIFKQISDQIESGGTSTELTESTVIKDIVSPQFTLPEGATADNITLETYECTGKDANGAYTWSKNADAMGATATITSTDDAHATTKDNQVSVTGFDFKENYVGEIKENGEVTGYRGNKLVITFNVKPRAGFLGGNGVYTNTNAGVYPDGNATDPVLTFDQPKVDVTIKKPTITLPDANVYLGAYFEDTVNSEDLKNGTTVKFGDDMELNLTKPDENWGLEAWQTEYVTIEVKVTDKDGNEVTNFEKLTEDTDYKVSVSIKPKTPKEGNNGYDESMEGTIHVFKPELTFRDSTAYYGEAVPENNDFSSNLVDEKWKNGEKYSTDEGVEMLGTKPTLDITCTPNESKLSGGKYTKQDAPVKATVKIGTDDVTACTTFAHNNCTGKTCTLPEGYHFWVHIQTCTLTINKTGGNADEPYVFTVLKDGGKYSEVTIACNGSETIYELPIGTYTIQEDTGWSWRFTGDNGNGAALSAQSPAGTITATNSQKNPYWLNGFSQVVKNIFGEH